MVYLFVTGIVVGGAITLVGGVMEDMDMEKNIRKKIAADLKRDTLVSVKDNGPVETKAKQPHQGRALV